MRVALLLAVILGVAPLSAAVSSDTWFFWTRDTHFKDRQPARQWRTSSWVMRGGPFDTRAECDRRMNEHLKSAAHWLDDGYRVTALLDTSVVARQQDGASGLRRRYMCLPTTVAPPR
jgi:hypothetical protein